MVETTITINPITRPRRKNFFLGYSLGVFEMTRFQFAVSVFLVSVFVGDSFTASPSRWSIPRNVIVFSTTNPDHAVETKQATQQGITSADIDIDIADIFPMPEVKEEIVPLTSEEFATRLDRQLAKLRSKDQTSKKLCKEVCCFLKRISRSN